MGTIKSGYCATENPSGIYNALLGFETNKHYATNE